VTDDGERLSFDPLPQEQYFAIESERERKLQAIGDVIGYWLKYVTKEREAENLPTDANTHVMLGYENAPPHWPTVGTLTYWLSAIRDIPARPIPADDAVERVIYDVIWPLSDWDGDSGNARYAAKQVFAALDSIGYSAPEDDAVTRVAKAISDARWERACKALGTSDYVRYEENWPMLIPEAEAVIEGDSALRKRVEG
jgi:hypothetical protein